MWFWAICIQYETFIRKVSAKLSVDCTYIVWQPSLLILSFWEPCGGLPVDESKGGLISNKRKNCSIEEIIQYTGIFLAGLLDRYGVLMKREPDKEMVSAFASKRA